MNFPEHAKLNVYAHGDEEQTQQQRLEWLDDGFKLMPVFAFGQQHAGQKRAQCHR